MKNMAGIAAVAGILAFSAFTAMAAGYTLTNGGFGQVAGNNDSFGIAVCNGGKQATTQAVPVSVSANGATVTVSSASSIAPGKCEYTYLQYSQLSMAAGNTYDVAVTIDPSHTLSANANNSASYNITVPGAPVAAAQSEGTTSGSGNFLATIGSAFAHFFASLKNIF